MDQDIAPKAERTKPKITCREIRDDELEAVAAHQARAFTARSRDYWLRGLRHQQARAIPLGYPRYGYVLDLDGRFVGGVLVFYSDTVVDGAPKVICNVGGWNVDPEFRGHAPRLLWAALSDKNVIYTDVTPAVSTYEIVERLGFRRYCSGLFVSLPFMHRIGGVTEVDIVSPDSQVVPGLSGAESELLLNHGRYGCLSMVCRTPQGTEPFILLPFRMKQGKHPLPAMQLVYCRNIESFKRCAGAIGRALLRKGRPFVLLDANAPVDGLIGFYTEKRGRKYFRGPHAPPLTDLTNTELVLFGL